MKDFIISQKIPVIKIKISNNNVLRSYSTVVMDKGNEQLYRNISSTTTEGFLHYLKTKKITVIKMINEMLNDPKKVQKINSEISRKKVRLCGDLGDFNRVMFL